MATATAVPKVKVAGGSWLLEERNPNEVFTPEDFTEEHQQIAKTAEVGYKAQPSAKTSAK